MPRKVSPKAARLARVLLQDLRDPTRQPDESQDNDTQIIALGSAPTDTKKNTSLDVHEHKLAQSWAISSQVASVLGGGRVHSGAFSCSCCVHACACVREYVRTCLCACACVRPCPCLHVILQPWHNAAGGGVGGSSTNRNEELGSFRMCRSMRTADAAGLWRPINGKQAAWFLGRCCCRRRSGWGEGGRA